MKNKDKKISIFVIIFDVLFFIFFLILNRSMLDLFEENLFMDIIAG
ncbi:MAG: hypothetical protein FWC36_05935 [Spirochaetes bacterium]|nr:hypothetical protein [Spirochaetota bacterium]